MSEANSLVKEGSNELPCGNLSPPEEETVVVPASPVEEIHWGQASFIEHSGERNGHKYGTTQPFADVLLKSGTENETLDNADGRTSYYGGEYSFEAMENTQSSESNTFLSDVGQSMMDRRKRRTIRRIDWETNYFPALDLHVPVHMKVVNHPIGKETAV